VESLDLGFWIGLALAIPLSIFGNLATPSIIQWWSRRSKARAGDQLKSLQNELDDIERIAATPGLHQVMLLEGVLFVTLITSFVGVFSGFFFVLSNFGFGGSTFLSQIGQLFAVIGGVLVTREVLETLRRSRKVKQVEKFRAEVAEKQRELKAASDA